MTVWVCKLHDKYVGQGLFSRLTMKWRNATWRRERRSIFHNFHFITIIKNALNLINQQIRLNFQNKVGFAFIK